MEHRSALSRLLWLLSTCLLAVKGTNFEFRDFIAKNKLSDGELETRIRFRGVTAKETTVSGGNRTGLTFRQLTDGRHFIQLIYASSMALRDCEYMDNDPKLVDKFLTAFSNELDQLDLTGNQVSVVPLGEMYGNEVPEDVQKWMKYHKLRNRCRKVQMRLRKAAKVVRQEDDEVGEGSEEQEEESNQRGAGAGRSKRDLSDMFRMPGTMWCGKGYSATKFTQLGGFTRTDKCCRLHDTACPFWIGGFHNKYGLFNWRVNTLMHCSCDERFRTCLKMIDTSDSNLIGKIFFNVVQTKCFVLKPKRVCIRRSWWGKKCLKWKVTKKAILKDNMPY